MKTTLLNIKLLSTFTLKCLDSVNEDRLISHFVSGVALNYDLEEVCKGELQVNSQNYEGDLEIPDWYADSIGLTKFDLENRDDIIYFQNVWNVSGDFYVTNEGMLRNKVTKEDQTLRENDFWLTFDSTVIGIELLGSELGDDHVISILEV